MSYVFVVYLAPAYDLFIMDDVFQCNLNVCYYFVQLLYFRYNSGNVCEFAAYYGSETSIQIYGVLDACVSNSINTIHMVF